MLMPEHQAAIRSQQNSAVPEGQPHQEGRHTKQRGQQKKGLKAKRIKGKCSSLEAGWDEVVVGMA